MDKNKKNRRRKSKKKQDNAESEQDEGEKTIGDDNYKSDVDLFLDDDKPVDKPDNEQCENQNEAGFDSDDIKINNDSEDDHDEVDDDIDKNTLLKILMQVHKTKSKQDKEE